MLLSGGFFHSFHHASAALVPPELAAPRMVMSVVPLAVAIAVMGWTVLAVPIAFAVMALRCGEHAHCIDGLNERGGIVSGSGTPPRIRRFKEKEDFHAKGAEKKKEDSVNHDADIVKHVERFRELNRLNEAVVSSYYRVVVYIAPLQEPVLHCWGCCGLVFFPYRLTVPERLQPQPPCWFVNQLDTARRFMWNEVTSDKRPVEPAASINKRGNNHGIPWN